jgi:hypothetical protein
MLNEKINYYLIKILRFVVTRLYLARINYSSALSF